MLLLFFAMTNLFIVGRLYQLFQYADAAAVVYTQGEVPGKVLMQLAKGNESNRIFSEVALWKYEGRDSVRVEGTGREQTVSVYRMKGQQRAVFGSGLFAGRYFTDGESSVCLLDKESIRTLFGSENVLGMKVRWKDTEFEIVGILEGRQPLCIIPGKEGDAYDGIAVGKAKAAASSGNAFGVLEASVGAVGQQRIDGHLYYMTACILYVLLIVFFFVAESIRWRKNKVIAVMYVLLAVEMLILGIGFASPGSDYLPSYWSDFDFFVQIFKEKSLQVQELLHHQEFVTWQTMIGAWQQTIVMEMIMGLLGGCLCDRQ